MVTSNKVATRENERKQKKNCVHDEKCLITNWSHRMILHVYAHIFLNGFLFAQHTNEMIYCLLVKHILSRIERGHETLLLMPLLYFWFNITLHDYHTCLTKMHHLFSPFSLQIERMISIKCNIFHTNWMCTLHCNKWNNIWYF